MLVKLGAETMQWSIHIAHGHGERIAAMPDESRNGRNLRDGYLRACGIEFGNVRQLCEADPLFRRAYGLTKGRTVVGPESLMNLFLIVALGFPKLPPGDIVEFGSYKGGSAIFLAVVAGALSPGTKVYAFDSFAGMPEVDTSRDMHRPGHFNDVSEASLMRYCSEIGVTNLVPVKGFFSETIPTALPTIGPVRLAHIDCDLYQSVAESYDGVKPFMVPGGYMVFDDPLISSCLGAFEAVEELVIRRDGLHAEQASPHLVYRAPR
jgi:macrocin-O-methyltransferase TylF-like protien